MMKSHMTNDVVEENFVLRDCLIRSSSPCRLRENGNKLAVKFWTIIKFYFIFINLKFHFIFAKIYTPNYFDSVIQIIIFYNDTQFSGFDDKQNKHNIFYVVKKFKLFNVSIYYIIYYIYIYINVKM